jgi:hypothetical protein
VWLQLLDDRPRIQFIACIIANRLQAAWEKFILFFWIKLASSITMGDAVQDAFYGGRTQAK